MTPDRLSARALNRATLARQLLLARSPMAPVEAIRHLVGMQAQAPLAPYDGLWCRLEDHGPEVLSDLLVQRRVARVVLMRGTLHLVVAEDVHGLRPLVAPVLDRDLRTNAQHKAAFATLDLEAVAAAGVEALADAALTPRDLGRRLAERWPAVAPSALAHAVRCRVPLVQVPPRGVWGQTGSARATTAATWLGPPSGPAPSLDDLVLRYLGAFGPASVRDVQVWSGLTGLAEVVERLGPRLRRFRAGDGPELVDLPEGPRPGPDVPAPVRLVAAFDDLVLSHADRTRVVPEDVAGRVFSSRNGQIPATVLVDGVVGGTWTATRASGGSTVEVTLFRRRVPAAVRAEVEVEGHRLLALSAPEGRPHHVRVHGS